MNIVFVATKCQKDLKIYNKYVQLNELYIFFYCLWVNCLYFIIYGNKNLMDQYWYTCASKR